MIRSLRANAERFLADLERIQRRGEKAEREVSSGLRVATGSDAPDEIGSILQLRADIQRQEQIHTNLVRVQSEVNSAEKTVQLAVATIERAIVLASQGAGTTVTAGQRTNLAVEVRGLHEQMVGLSRSTVAGRFIFSGDLDQQPAYALNTANANGVDRLITPAATRRVEEANGITFLANRTAQEIFDHRDALDAMTTNNAFWGLNSLRVALEANDQPGVETALNNLRVVHNHLNTQLAFYGGTQTRLAGAVQQIDKNNIQLKGDLAARQEADVVAASLALNESQTQLEAAMSARARLPRRSLFEYLG
ncbi:MAG: hypothetical protein FJW37_00515 [Acidobacteria bacterium]|nr:hypothetical protein [Acidobacteriota bacterium]